MLRLKLIDRYIVRQYLVSFFFILGMVMAIAFVVDLVEKIDDFLDKDPPMIELLRDYYANFFPYYGNLLSPVCIYLAVIFFTSRMAQRTELVSVLSAGVSFYRILLPYLLTSILLGGVSFYLKGYLIPNTTQQRIGFEYKYFRKKRISSNKDIHKKVAPDTYVYISYYNERKREGHTFSMEKIEDGDIIQKTTARQIIWVDSSEKWRLQKVRIHDIKGNEESLEFIDAKDTTFLLTPDDSFVKEQWAETMVNPDLHEYITLEEMRGSDILNDLYTEEQRRYADPVAIIILTLIGYAMASKKSRGGIALQIGLGLIITFVFIALLFAGPALLADRMPVRWAVWLPNILFLPLAIYLLWRAPK